MKALTTAGLTKLIQLIKSSFIKTTDTVTTNTVTLATVATSGSYNDLSNKPTIPTVDQTFDGTSTNAQSGVAIEGELANYQNKLVSGTNIKTINNTSLLGSGDIDTKEIFIANNTTTYDEISYVLLNGKTVFFQTGNFDIYYQYTRSTGTEHQFASLITLSNGTIRVEYATVNTSNIWNITSYDVADTDLSNLSSTGKTVIDGQWIVSDTVIGQNLNLNGSTPLEFTLQVPEDGNKYDVLLSAVATSTSTSGQLCGVGLRSALSNSFTAVCRCIPRSATAVYASGNIILPLSTDRKLYLERSSTTYGSVSIYLKYYRRIGSNT